MGPEWLKDDGFTARLTVTLRRDRFLHPGYCRIDAIFISYHIRSRIHLDRTHKWKTRSVRKTPHFACSFQKVKVSISAAGDSPALFSGAFRLSRVLFNSLLNRRPISPQPWLTLVQYASMLFVSTPIEN